MQINTAKLQEIVLNQYFPALGISRESIENFTPILPANSINPSVEFQAAGYRFGHGAVRLAIDHGDPAPSI